MPNEKAPSQGQLQVTTISLPRDVHGKLKAEVAKRKMKGERTLSMAAYIEGLIRRDLQRSHN
jgi:hypothetical protein